MKTKKIIIPEVKQNFKRHSKPPRPKPEIISPKFINHRQRSEAIGLLMIGFSAFCFSLFHFLSASKVGGIVFSLMANIGFGVYIIPALIGLMGVQRFLERPFENFFWRVVGTIIALFFGLGLLGLEGGKAGTALFQVFSGKFGYYPSKILFFFFTLSGMIFSLDILYKDVLASFMVLVNLLVRVLVFSWELTLSLLGMLIEAVKTTSEFFTQIIRGTILLFQAQEPLPFPNSTKLIPITREDTVSHDLESDPVSCAATQPAPIPTPVSWRDGPMKGTEKSVDTENSSGAEKIVIATPLPVTISFEQFPTTVCLNQNLPSPTPPEKATSAEKEPAATEARNPSESASIKESSPKVQEKTVAEKAISEEEEVDLSFDDEKIPDDEQGENIDTPISLDDHPIDRDLRKNSSDSSEEQTEEENSYSKSLLPPLELLNVPPERETQVISDLSERSALLLKTLAEFGIKADITAVVEGPAVSRFELKPGPGIKVARITSLVDDIALALAAPAVRIEAPIPGKTALGIEIPNPKPNPVFFYDLIKNERFRSSETLLNLALGVTISGRPVFADLSEMPHLLIAGSTGSGKSVCINTIIASILYQARADQVKMVMVDPKMVELSSYNGIPHLISPVVTDPKKASAALLWAVEEMERRYELLAFCGVRKISTFNEDLGRLKKEVDPDLEYMPLIVIIIDELADLMMTASAQVEGSICRLAQMARAVGIHLIIATQRPSVDVLTGIIKANLPSRIAFSVASQIDSRTILDSKGAERLLGKGDMLFIPKGKNKPLRLQGAFISDGELSAITKHVCSQGKPEYLDIAPTKTDEEEKEKPEEAPEEDDDGRLLVQIENYLATQEKTSTSMLQRKFKIGYNRAARIMDILEQKGFVSPLDGSNKRRVIGRRSAS